jgi:fructosamine-3-kinase
MRPEMWRLLEEALLQQATEMQDSGDIEPVFCTTPKSQVTIETQERLREITNLTKLKETAMRVQAAFASEKESEWLQVELTRLTLEHAAAASAHQAEMGLQLALLHHFEGLSLPAQAE